MSSKEVRRATMLHLQHNVYDDLRSRDASTSLEQHPSELEEIDPIYKVVAAPVVVNWETPQSRASRPRPMESRTEEAFQITAGEGVIERNVRRRVAGRLHNTSSERTHSAPPTTPTGSIPRRSVVVKAPHIAHPSRCTVPPTSTSVGVHHAESSRVGELRSSSPQSPKAPIDVARATVLRRTDSAHAVGGAFSREGPHTSRRNEEGGSTCRGRRGRRGGRRTRPRTEKTSQADGGIEEEVEDIDEP